MAHEASRLPLLRSLALLALLALPALAQVPGVSREQMWFAPTAEDWRKPCLITFQRNWEDAEAVSRATGKPILICINMDGEIASEHYAGIRYRQKDKAKLYEPYVCVIASTYRHTPRDYDEHGHRVLCPRFGSVTCGEHINIEPLIYERYCEGQRIAPRHIMVELDGKETYDVFHTFDTDSVFAAIRDGISNRKIKPKPLVKGDRSLLERVSSPDVKDREAVEKGFAEGSKELRRSLLEAAIKNGEKMPLEVLRLALNGLDDELSRRAREALAKTEATGGVELISEALQVPMDEKERDALIAALARLGGRSSKARRLSSVHKGLATKSKVVDMDRWAKAMGGGTYAPPSRDEISGTLETQNEARVSADPKARLALAEAFLDRAIEKQGDAALAGRFSKALFEDARETALEAEGLGLGGWRVNTVIAVASHYLGDVALAEKRAALAVKDMPEDPKGWNTMIVLGLFSKHCYGRIVKAVEAKKPWPGEWLTDMHAAQLLLVKHPDGHQPQIVSHYDFLRWLGARSKARSYLSLALKRFPDNWELHRRLRESILRSRGVAGLEGVYDRLLAEPDASPAMTWYAGHASVVAAEFHRRRNRDARAEASYARAITLFEKALAANEDYAESSKHYIAMALGGRARIAYEKKEWQRALDFVVASFERWPAAANALDGLNISSVDTAKMLLARLKEQKLDDMATKLDEAMKKLDPEMLKLPAYEGVGGGNRGGARRNRQGGGRRRRQGGGNNQGGGNDQGGGQLP